MKYLSTIAPDGTRILMPNCGISYRQIVDAAWSHKTIAAAAVHLGVGETTLRHTVTAHGLSLHFVETGPRCPSKITKRRLKYWLRQGMTRTDIAAAMEVTYSHLNKMIRHHGLHTGLPNRGTAAWIARRGYVGKDSVGNTPEGRFTWA